MDNWLLIIVGVVFLISIVVGYIRGFFKIGVSLLASLLTVALVICLAPYISGALSDFTPIDELIEEKCTEMFMPEVSADILAGKDLSDTPLAGLDADQISQLSESDLEQYGISERDLLDMVGEIPKDRQIQGIEGSALPKFLKDALLENNNTTIYGELGVSTFVEYVASYIARMIIHIASFLITFILAIIIVKALIVAVDIIGELPGVGFFNHLGGGVVGAFTALLIVWIGFLVVTVIYTTDIGKMTFAMIEQSPFLTFLYDKNILLSKLISF